MVIPDRFQFRVLDYTNKNPGFHAYHAEKISPDYWKVLEWSATNKWHQREVESFLRGTWEIIKPIAVEEYV